jgi:short-subunit dehydrogenase
MSGSRSRAGAVAAASLQGTRALITGASSGIGRALALRLARRGVGLVVAARRTALLDTLVEEIERAGGRAEALALDVEDYDRTEALVREHAERRRFDLVVANAGTGALTPAHRPDWPTVRRIMVTNYVGAAATLYGALPSMLAAGRGHLVGVSSPAGLGRSLPGMSAYSSSKSGFTTLLEGLAIDLVPRGIQVTTVLPGYVRTELTSKNRFRMPFIVEADTAAAHIEAAIATGARFCSFPLPITLFTRALPLLPDSLYEKVARRRPRTKR